MGQTGRVLLTLTSTAPTATDLGYLLFKHPGKVQTFDLPVGSAHVFYPDATDERCTVALLLEVDPIALVRGRKFGGGDAFSLGQYVNDRPYAASSMLAVALGRVFNTAMTGRCDSRPELVGQPLPLQIHLPALPCTGGAALARRLFEPMGGVARYIRQRRLAGAALSLADPELRATRLGDVGFRWGFATPSSFTRAFRQAFGVSPSVARERGVAPARAIDEDAPLDGARRLARWMRTLRG